MGATPISVGGDHTIPLPILRAIARKQPVGVVQIDSHADTLDTLAGTKVNHATAFRRGVEEGLLEYQRRRVRRVREFVLGSRRIGVVGQWENPVLCGIRDAVLRVVPRGAMARRVKALAGFELLTAREKGLFGGD